MKKRVLAIAATAMATMMMASPVMAQDFKIGICTYVDDASLNQIVDNIQSRLEEIGKEKDVNFDVSYDNCNADANVMEQIISDFQTRPVTIITTTVVITVIRMIGTHTGFSMPQAVSNPTPAGINITGMISMRNSAASLTCSSLIMCVPSAISMITSPYTLAGTGSGIRTCNASPIADISKIIQNCLTYFIFSLL